MSVADAVVGGVPAAAIPTLAVDARSGTAVGSATIAVARRVAPAGVDRRAGSPKNVAATTTTAGVGIDIVRSAAGVVAADTVAVAGAAPVVASAARV